MARPSVRTRPLPTATIFLIECLPPQGPPPSRAPRSSVGVYGGLVLGTGTPSPEPHRAQCSVSTKSGQAHLMQGMGFGLRKGPPPFFPATKLQAESIWPIGRLVGRFGEVTASDGPWVASAVHQGSGLRVCVE